MDPIISIIVPVYKAEKLLPACIESILNQTFSKFELILVDDGSPDSSGAICDGYANKDPRVCVIHKDNGGVSSARNTGIDHSRGQWITFVDSDDSVDERFLEDCYELVQKEQADLCIGGLFVETWEKGRMIDSFCCGGKDKTYTIKELLEAKEMDYPTICTSGPWCKLYRASIIRDNRLHFDETMALGEDTCFVHSFLEQAHTAVFTQNCYYHYYRGNSDSLYSRYHENFFELYAKVAAKILSVMTVHNCSEYAMRLEKVRCASLLMESLNKEYIVYYAESSNEKRRQVMEKTANHPLIAECKATNYSKGFSAMIYLAVQHKWYCTADFLLRLKRRRADRS